MHKTARYIFSIIVIAAILFGLLQWWYWQQQQQQTVQEGLADLTQFTSTMSKMFMTPPTKKSNKDDVPITKSTFDAVTNTKKDVTYYVPKGWYIVMINEMIPAPKLANPIKGTVPRMTILHEDCKLGDNGEPVPKNPKSKTSSACLNFLDIADLKTAKNTSEAMNANTRSQVEDFFKNYPDRVLAFFGRNQTDPQEDKALTKAMSDYDVAMKSGEDYEQAFDKSQSALEKAKKDFKKTNDKVEKPPNFDVSNTMLQFDPAMPVFWGNALLENKDNLMPLFREPGSFRYYGKTYVPSYDDSVFYSSLTGLPEYTAVKQTPDQMGGFCQQLGTDKDALEQKCNSLSSDVCASTDCCVFLGGSKCVAGNTHGPTTSSNYSDFTIQNRDFYYFKGKCYGNCYQNGASSMYVNSVDKFPNKDIVTAANDIANALLNASVVKDAEKTKKMIESSPATPKKVNKKGDVIDAMYSATGGEFTVAHGNEQWYSAKIIKDKDTLWQVQWSEGPRKDKLDDVDKDTLQIVEK